MSAENTRLIAAVLLGILVAVTVQSRCDPDREQSFPDWDPNIVIQLHEQGYTPVDARKRPSNAVSIPGVSTTLHGAGVAVRPDSVPVWPDTLPVVVSLVEDPQGMPWLGVWVDGVPVTFSEPPRIRWPEAPKPSPLSVIGEYAILPSGGSFGAGASWEPLRIASLSAGPCLTISTRADWAALSVRISRRWGPLSVGAGVGYRIGRDEGVHAGVSAGLAIDL